MLQAFVHIRKKVSDSSVTANEIIGTLTPDVDDYRRLKELSGSCIDEIVKVGSERIYLDDILTDGKSIEINLYPHRISKGYYFGTVADLINRFSQTLPDHPYYIYELDYYSSILEAPKPIQIVDYENTIKLISLLTEISDYQKPLGNKKELVFFQSKKLVLSTEYTSIDIHSIKSIALLLSHLSTTHDKEERKSIFINELINNLLPINNPRDRFVMLLVSFDEIFEKYQKGHKFYLEQFSFEKIKSELDNEKIAYANKIQDVINGVQTKLISIPAAFLLIVSQFDLTGEEELKNIALLLSSFIFGYLLDVLIKNQYSALWVISEDLKKFKERFQAKKEQLPVKDFDATFSTISRLYIKQKKNLHIIRFLVWITPAFSLILFLLIQINREIFTYLKLSLKVIWLLL